MPMLDACIPGGALSPDAEEKLLARPTDLLLEHEGVDPANQAARALAWVFVHRPAVYVGGSPTPEPRYRFVCQVPEGQCNSKRREAVTAAMTQAVADAEAGQPTSRRRPWMAGWACSPGAAGCASASVTIVAACGAASLLASAPAQDRHVLTVTRHEHVASLAMSTAGTVVSWLVATTS